MSRPRSSISYDILHGIQFSGNRSMLSAYLTYFPPPPPAPPAPPPRRSWTCSSHSSESLSCFVSNDERNSVALRPYIAWNDFNRSKLFENTSRISAHSTPSNRFSSLFQYLINSYRQHQFLFILFTILLLALLFIAISSLIFFLYFQRHRQRPMTSNNKCYYSLIPHRTAENNKEHKLVRLNKDSPTAQVICLSEIQAKDPHESEDAV